MATPCRVAAVTAARPKKRDIAACGRTRACYDSETYDVDSRFGRCDSGRRAAHIAKSNEQFIVWSNNTRHSGDPPSAGCRPRRHHVHADTCSQQTRRRSDDPHPRCTMSSRVQGDWRTRVRESWRGKRGDLRAGRRVDVSSDPLAQSLEPDSECGVIEVRRTSVSDDPLASAVLLGTFSQKRPK